MASYDKLGVKKIINAAGTYTKYSGSLMHKQVVIAMQQASKHFVDIDELLDKSGKYISDLLKTESALITSGAAAGMTIATAACIAGSDLSSIKNLPDANNLSNEIIIMRSHRNFYDQAMRTAGAKFVEIGNAIETFPWEISSAINEKTAAIAYFVQSDLLRSSVPLSKVIEVAHSKNIPVIVDAAAELPPSKNLYKFTQMGADLVLFSGGKDLRGPQSSGLMLGKKKLIDNCKKHSYPNHAIGRPMKLDKETIIGLVTAIELYLEENHDARMKRWKRQVETIKQNIISIPYIKIKIDTINQPLTQPSCIPRIFIQFHENEHNLDKETVAQKLMNGSPPIAVVIDKNTLNINPHMLNDGEEKIIVDKINNILSGG